MKIKGLIDYECPTCGHEEHQEREIKCKQMRLLDDKKVIECSEVYEEDDMICKLCCAICNLDECINGDGPSNCGVVQKSLEGIPFIKWEIAKE